MQTLVEREGDELSTALGEPGDGVESSVIATAGSPPELELDPPSPPPPVGRSRSRWEPIRILGFALIALGLVVTFAKLGGIGRSHDRAFAFRWPWDWRPGDLLRRTTPTGGDMGSHVWTPDFLRRHLLGQGRLTGWADDWYAGFPVVGFYFPLPMWIIALLSFVLPYGVAFKVVTVAGLLGLPVAAWGFGRLAGLPRPYPVILALSAFPYIYSVHYDEQIYGGTVTSTMAGEFSFSISLAFSVLFLGYWVHVLRTGKKRGPAALALAATGLCHLLPTIFVLVTAALFVLTEIGVRKIKWQLRDGLIAGALGGALAAFWLFPFAKNLDYSNNMGWDPKIKYVANLFPFWPNGWPWKHHKLLPNVTPPTPVKAPVTSAVVAVAFLFALIAFGCGLVAFVRWAAGKRRPTSVERVIVTFSLVAVIAAVLFRKLGYFRLWNARVLPFWFLAIYFLAAIGFVQVGKSLAASARWMSRGTRTWKSAPVWGTALAGLVTYVAVGTNLGMLPGHLPIPRDRNGMIGLQFAGQAAVDANYGPGWALYNFAGYEKRSAWNEYQQLMSTMRRVGATNGCGRAMWENAGKGGRDMGRFGTPMALMLLPYWTRSCIGSMEGLYFESSATTPYHFMNAALVSHVASTAQRDLPYGSFDMTKGVQKLQGFGVKYYLAFSGHAQQEADKNADLKLVATSPLSGQCDADEQKAYGCPTDWKIYEVAKSDLVSPLPYEPVKAKGIGQSQDAGWLDMSVNIYNDPVAYPVPVVASGLKSWQEVKVTRKKPKNVRTYGSGTTIGPVEKRALPAVAIHNIKHGVDTLSFDVDKPNVPVLVKISYFPNWKVEGGKGPYRVSPNFMVVIPTKGHVKMHFGRTGVDYLGYLLAIGGIGTVVALKRRDGRNPELAGASAFDPGFTPQGDPQPSEPLDRTPDAADHRRASGAGLFDDTGQLGSDIPSPFGPQDELGIEQIDPEQADLSNWRDVDSAHGLHPMGVGDLEAEPFPEQESKDPGHEAS